ncbi:hypothetical protein A2988_03215 [Candidatus Azambacteria bacterium RIFCSPLOWO2_01_FULL_46_25]|uniref:Type 4 fimbrial biogenesis protein PilX N-terminal domain-containing protein n=1 Tax=Candidatus Azambacteria bacterium RIFCSPLOWO2_01_FULL_46_25 TaxID=1797298 RepID=A0A1F5BV69_9BACT|nr:MAG: hypothetical protein A2988_03215 [Candidatus Azambacteria bacterium RIFCSPLOWO2_01_FULL_46_25]OGD38013.1 MAG: hypothetical protein A2850_02885 [Candidatus Azambacteria bacterium RIFCSPHIGHO2_01_FULL_51_74]
MQNSIQKSNIPLKANKLTKLKADEGFAAIVSVISVIALGLIFSSGFLFVTVQNTAALKDQLNSAQSYYASEAGIEDAIYRVKNGKNIGAQTVLAVGSAAATTTISSVGQTKTILAEGGLTGTIRRVQTTLALDATQSDFRYGVQIGAGGLEMKQNSVINGSVYSDGNITCASSCSGTKILGDAWVAGGAAAGADQQSTATTSDFIVGKTVGGNDQWDGAQSFIPSINSPITKASLYLKKVGNPPDATIRIIEDKSGKPGGSSDEVTSGTLNASSVTANYGWIDIGFSSNPTIVTTKTYWIVLDASNDASNYWTWGYSTANPYASGQGKYSRDWSVGNPTWTNVNASANSDLAFKVFLGGVATKIDGLLVTGDAHANTILNAQVCGNAYYTTIDSSSLTFLNSPGSPCTMPYTPGTGTIDVDPPVIPMSITQSNIDLWKASAEAGGTTPGPYSPPNGTIIGPQKIDGDLNFTTNGNTYYINGPVWVAGNVTISNNVKVILSASYGPLSTTVVADSPGSQTTSGKIVVDNGVNICGSSGYNSGTDLCNASNGSYIMFLSTYSGTDKAITLKNNSEGAIFYASAGSLEVEQTASAKQITGYKVELENNATITYESGLQSVSFSSGPSAGWTISGWKEVQ